MEQAILAKRVQLNNGVEIPTLGLGVWQANRGSETQGAVLEALRLGYRHIDTARVYGNEQDVGVALRASGLAREQVFVTTKLWNDDQGYDDALRAFDQSLKRLGLEYVDLYLIHWPVPGKRRDSWRALEQIASERRARAIGVSNYMTRHLSELVGHAKIVPAVNQIEISPFLQQRDTRHTCATHGIAVEAYSPLTRARKFAHPVIQAVAQRLGRSPAQVLLRWSIAEGLIPLPKSVHPARIAENAQLDFEFPQEEWDRLNALDEGLVTGWDPREEG
jgi:diketogulonate reductase-like aldo/keto reductase